MPTLEINGIPVTVAGNATVLEAAQTAGVSIPTLCHAAALMPSGACRLCVVDMSRSGWDDDYFKMVTACNHPVEDGMRIVTDSERVLAARQVVLDLLLARCPSTPLIRKLAAEHGITKTSFVPNPEHTDCILCGLCYRVCDHLGISAISAINRGPTREIAPPLHQPPPDCIGCLACAEICPTDHITFSSNAAQRTIWGKTFELLRCTQCGTAHITVAQADFYADRAGVPRSYFETCDACKRRHHAEVFASMAQAGEGVS